MSKFWVSPLVFLLAAAMIFFGVGYECLSYFIAVIMHELAHAEVSRRLGYSLVGIKLMPYGASLTGAFEGVKASDEIIIALTGPISNIVIAVVCIALWWLAPITYFVTEIFVFSNIFTAVFNLIPIFPLDGGRALLALISTKVPRQKAYRVMRWFGIGLAVIFSALFVVSAVKNINFSFAVIAIFILVSTIIPDKNSKYQRLYSMGFRSEKIKQGLTVRETMVDGKATVLKLLRFLNSNYYHKFTVVNDSFVVIGTITETQLEAISLKYPHDKKICDILLSKS